MKLPKMQDQIPLYVKINTKTRMEIERRSDEQRKSFARVIEEAFFGAEEKPGEVADTELSFY
jgi:hypothetical protein